ncbi:ABC transporter substrate-binding protein [Halobacillus seohaensis]|uniref:Thiamine pyrimidine synthase n=1 Tax=Halobacillus seohaensis TaxID=447421 RepID=A0ABW2EHD8_9BACI
MKTLILHSLVFTLIVGWLGGCGSDQDQQTESDEEKGELQEELKVASWSQHITEQTNLLVDEEKSFFREQGIDLTVIPGQGGGDAIKNILTGKADVAFTDPGSLFFALDKGEDLRVIYNIYPQNVFNVVALKESGITKPADLKGKKIGVYSLSSGTRQNLLILLNQVGLTEDDVDIVETGLLNFAPLMQGKVDATAATDTGLFIGKQKSLGEVNVMEVKDHLNFPSDLFVVTEDVFQQKKGQLQKFLTGYRNSAAWMMKSPEEAAKLAQEYTTDGKDIENNMEIIKLRNKSSVSSLTEKKGLGTIDTEKLQRAADTYKQLDLIDKSLNMEEVVNTELLPAK